MIRARSVALAVAVALVLPAAGGATALAGGGKQGAQLSNERTVTRWAHPAQRSPIRTKPQQNANPITSTHFLTEDGFPEVYLALRSWSEPKGPTWIKVRIPMRPNGTTGWVLESALGPLYKVGTHLIVDRSKRKATFYKNGKKVWDAPVGIGKSSTPTPTGKFWVREKFKTGDPNGAYGPAAFGTSDYSVLSEWPSGGVIGIHGTNEPSLIPGTPSHGCIRLRNGDLRHLYHLMPIGTPVSIR
jgi:lipoprotein-anchoring transpeptidase ErfK/SrfK